MVNLDRTGRALHKKYSRDGTAVQKMGKKRLAASMMNEFEKVYKEYYQEIYKFVYRNLKNEQMAEDITQDTFYAALKMGNDFLLHPKPGLWLLVTARYKMYELYRKMRYWATQPLEEDCPELSTKESYYEDIVLELTALTIISQEEWSLIKNYYLIGITAKELAEAEGITENNLRVRLTRLKKKLRDAMER